MATNKILSGHELERTIAEMGGEEEMLERLAAFGEVVDHYEAHLPEILERHPGQWIAYTKDGVVVSGDDARKVVTEAVSKGLRNPYVIYRFVDPDPPVMIL